MGSYCATDPPAKRGGRKRNVDVRDVVNGLMYILRALSEQTGLSHLAMFPSV